MSTTPKLHISSLTKKFGTGSQDSPDILRNVNLTIQEGEFVSVVGASGCGKTTLLRIIDGLIRATSGVIQLDGKVVTGPGRDRAFVFQSDSLLPWRRLIDNVGFGLELQGQGRSTEERRRRALEYIALVGLAGFESHFPSQLSGGMRQRANLARALVIDPEILLMDEPFASLDAQTREIMQGELLRIWNTGSSTSAARKTVLFVTHQIDEAVYLSDRVIVMSARPGAVKEEIVIDLPRPRQLEDKHTVQFVNYTNRIWKLIETEVRDVVSRELVATP